VRALHLINGEHFSGAERVQQLLGKRLPEQSVEPHFVCLKAGKFSEMCGLEPEKVSVQAMKSRVDLSLVKKIANQAREMNADLLHAHTPRSASIASLVARSTGLPWVFHVHSPTSRDSTRAFINRMNDWIERWSLWNCNHIIAVSKSLRREMLKRGYDRQKVTCIPNGVAEQTPIDAYHKINEENWTLGMVALIRPRKGIEVLLDAMSRVKQNLTNVKLDVVGPFETKEYEADVIQLVHKFKLEDTVRFHGFIRDVPEAMRRLDAMVLPSLFGEGMPMVVLEALALGVPVIATEVEGTPEVVRDGVTNRSRLSQDVRAQIKKTRGANVCTPGYVLRPDRANNQKHNGFRPEDLADSGNLSHVCGGIPNPELLNLAGVARLPEGDHTIHANLLHRSSRWLEIIPWIELVWMLGQHFTNSPGDSHSAVSINVDLSNTAFDTSLNFFYGHTPCLLHRATILVDDVLKLLWNATRSVHHQVSIGDSLVNFFDSSHCQYFTVRFSSEFVGAVTRSDRNGQRVAAGLSDKSSCFVWVR